MNIRELEMWLNGKADGQKVDLRKADLRGADLRKANLSGADLRSK